MCGICGFVGPPDLDSLRRMRDALTHRGPDDAGEWIDGNINLGHRRLSVVDLAGGHQPMSSDDDTVTLVFNGEIYNHPQLRSTFEQQGIRYHTNADTESVLHAYRQFGTCCLDYLQGMFAFVLYDRRRRVLFGARDRMGKKPLYYTTRYFGEASDRIEFAFASEVESLRQHSTIASGLRLSSEALIDYLLNDYVPGARCIYEGIAKLEAGHAFTYGLADGDQPGFRTWRYWQPPAFSSLIDIPSIDDAADRLIQLLDAAVERRLMSDVPLGALLSGGIDSTTVVALLARHRPPGQIKTFCIGFEEEQFDESSFAAEAARELGTDHHTWHFGVNEFRAEVPRVARLLDEPLADPSLLPYSMLCAAARQQVTVVLGGDGGDELFAGYDPFHAVQPAQWYDRLIPNSLHRHAILPLAHLLPVSDSNLSWSFKLQRFIRGAKSPSSYRLAAWMGSFSLAQLRLLLPDWSSQLDPARGYHSIISTMQPWSSSRVHPIDRASAFFQRLYLTDDILVKADRGSMLHSLEVRSPFLDQAVVEFVNPLPAHYKYRLPALTTKYLLKRAVGARRGRPALIPKHVSRRKKKGFGIPLGRWIRGPLRQDFETALKHEWPSQLSMFDRRQIAHFLDQHLSRRRDHYKELWSLYLLASWVQQRN